MHRQAARSPAAAEVYRERFLASRFGRRPLPFQLTRTDLLAIEVAHGPLRAAFEHEHPLAGFHQLGRYKTAGRARTNDENINLIHIRLPFGGRRDMLHIGDRKPFKAFLCAVDNVERVSASYKVEKRRRGAFPFRRIGF